MDPPTGGGQPPTGQPPNYQAGPHPGYPGAQGQYGSHPQHPSMVGGMQPGMSPHQYQSYQHPHAGHGGPYPRHPGGQPYGYHPQHHPGVPPHAQPHHGPPHQPPPPQAQQISQQPPPPQLQSPPQQQMQPGPPPPQAAQSHPPQQQQAAAAAAVPTTAATTAPPNQQSNPVQQQPPEPGAAQHVQPHQQAQPTPQAPSAMQSNQEALNGVAGQSLSNAEPAHPPTAAPTQPANQAQPPPSGPTPPASSQPTGPPAGPYPPGYPQNPAMGQHPGQHPKPLGAPPGAGPQYTNTPRYTHDNLSSMQRALHQLQAQGKMHDPRYHQLVNAVRQAEAQLRRSNHSTFTPSQLGQLRAQIMAYKQLSRTQHIDPNLLSAVKGNIRPPGPPGAVPGVPPSATPPAGPAATGSTGSIAQSPVTPLPVNSQPAKTEPTFPPGQPELNTNQPTPPTSTPSTNQSNPPTPVPGESRPSTAPPEKDESDKENNKAEVKQEGDESEMQQMPETPKALWTESPVPERTNDLAELLRDKRPGYGQHKITPIQKPKGIDPSIILEEGERRINARIANRINEIEHLPANLPSDLRVRAEIELRSLRLLGFQRQLRQDVMGVLRRDTTLETALNTKAYRRPKRQTLKEARITEKIEKQHKTEGTLQLI